MRPLFRLFFCSILEYTYLNLHEICLNKFRDFRLLIQYDAVACHSARRDRFGNCVAAQTVAAMETAGHFTRRIEARNLVSAGV